MADEKRWWGPHRGHVPHQGLRGMMVQFQGEDLGESAVIAGGAGEEQEVRTVVGLRTVLYHVGTTWKKRSIAVRYA